MPHVGGLTRLDDGSEPAQPSHQQRDYPAALAKRRLDHPGQLHVMTAPPAATDIRRHLCPHVRIQFPVDVGVDRISPPTVPDQLHGKVTRPRWARLPPVIRCRIGNDPPAPAGSHAVGAPAISTDQRQVAYFSLGPLRLSARSKSSCGSPLQ